MIWDNLKLIPPCCPICEQPLEYIEGSDRWICSDVVACDFVIRNSKFEEITNNMVDGDVNFSGDCEICGKKINPQYRTCKNCN